MDAYQPGVDVAGRQTEIAERLLDLLAEMASVEKMLAEVAGLAVDTVPGCDMASVTVIREGEPATVASSDDRARRVDETQYANDGPCLQAARTDEPVQYNVIHLVGGLGEAGGSGSGLGSGQPDWRRTAREVGITASLSLPIASTADIAAALNLYRLLGVGWTRESIDVAEYLADYAGSAVTVAYRLSEK